MGLSFKFAIVSDLHIALPVTIWDHPSRFHLVELSIPAFENILLHLAQLELDFLLLPGDLTQHGEPENHQWLVERLLQLPYPVYVIPGNHDVPTVESLDCFADYYKAFGYSQPPCLYYEKQILPGVRLIGLNSNLFDKKGNQIGWVDAAQLDWLQSVLRHRSDELVMVTIHHNILEHLPGQGSNPLGQRYMLGNANRLCSILHEAGVKLVFTGHLHVQDVAYSDRYDLYDITTGSIVSYPHPYRVLNYESGEQGTKLEIQSYKIESLPEFPALQQFSREWMGDRSSLFMMKLLTRPPLCLESAIAEKLTPHLRYFWADLADGDAQFKFPDFPAEVRNYFEGFSDQPPADNNVTLTL